MAYDVHIFTPDEWPALQAAGTLPAIMPLPGSVVVGVRDRDGALIARWFAVDTVALEGLYIDPAYRGNPTVARLLFVNMMRVLHMRGVMEAITLIQDPAVEELARAAGFEPIEGRLWRIDLGKG